MHLQLAVLQSLLSSWHASARILHTMHAKMTIWSDQAAQIVSSTTKKRRTTKKKGAR